MESIKKMIDIAKKKPSGLIKRSFRSNALKWVPDPICLKILYGLEMGKKLELQHPETYNEKLQWLKLHDRNPEYVRLVDKCEVREIIRNTIGEQYLIPLIGVYKHVDEIDWEGLPNQFVMKCTHGSGCNIICKDKSKLDIHASKQKLRKWMKANWYYYGREWPYKSIRPRIICEELLSDEGKIPDDYKVVCFNGIPKLIQLHHDRHGAYTMDFYNTSWEKLKIKVKNVPRSITTAKAPDTLQEMLALSRIIAEGKKLVRVDFYSLKERLYFGEITLYPAAGFAQFENYEDDFLLGKWIDK